MTDKNELNQKYMEFQMLDQNLKQVNQQLLNLDNQLLELQGIEENLGELKKTKKNTEILVALGGGVFSKAELKENNTILMNVGANIIVEKDIPASKEVIGHQIDQIKDFMKQLEQEFQMLAANSQALQMDLQKAASDMKEEEQ
ncbi:MAG: prefoldin subunit alpha [Nanoarchaeota archaeon]|nr:prefoldin subunit alpha [Nanoarchaeota archaeon]